MKVGWKRQARCTTGSFGADQKMGRRKSAHLSSARKKSSLSMMKRNRKIRRTKRTGAKRRHIAGRAYNTGHGGSKATSKWHRVRITLHAGFTITTKQIQALLTAARASGGKDEYQVRLTDIEREYWMGT